MRKNRLLISILIQLTTIILCIINAAFAKTPSLRFSWSVLAICMGLLIHLEIRRNKLEKIAEDMAREQLTYIENAKEEYRKMREDSVPEYEINSKVVIPFAEKFDISFYNAEKIVSNKANDTEMMLILQHVYD